MNGWRPIAVCVVLAGCAREQKDGPDASPLAAGPVRLTEQEPNDRPDQAQVLTDSSIVEAGLSADPSKPDEDWYLLAPPAPKTVDLTVSGIPGVDVAIEVYDTDRNRLTVVNSEGDGKPERIPNLGVKSKLLIKVFSSKRGAGGAYSLTALFSNPAPGFEAEPNDRAADANSATFGQPISGFLGHSADEDWYRYEVSASDSNQGPNRSPAEVDAGADAGGGESPIADAGLARPGESAALDAGLAQIAAPFDAPRVALRIEITGVDGVRYDLQVLSEAEASLFSARGKGGEGMSLRNIGVRANDRLIYVVVRSAWSGSGKDARRGYNAQKPYTLTVSKEEAGANAELEPNDEISKATPLPPNGFREGFISPKGDVDYYVLRTEQPVLAKLQLSGVERLDLVLSVVKPTEDGKGEQVLLRANDGAVKEPEILNSVYCPSVCWVKVEGALRKVDGKLVRDYENSEQPYRLTATVVPDDGTEEREPNNTPATATPIALHRPIRGTIHPKKDVDYFRLDLSGKPVKTSIKASVTGVLKLHIGLYLRRLLEDGRSTLVQTADRAKGDAPEIIRYSAEPGIYLLEVRDSKNRESNFLDWYQLTVEEGN
ncbi:MAG TPA: ABC transporter substrate-binding protein [Myxococcaceae bacterium]|nr:ABC transporter substrate-binding protein [Myxococcaceae bacterium]